MLDQNIDQIEKEVIKACPVPPLNLPDPAKGNQ